MIFNFTDIINKFLPNPVRTSYEARHGQAIGNRDFRNSVLSLPMEQSLANLRQIQGRVLSRINKEKDAGENMASTTELFNKAILAINRAELALAQATSTPNIINGVHPLYINARFMIDNARDELMQVVDRIPERTQKYE